MMHLVFVLGSRYCDTQKLVGFCMANIWGVRSQDGPAFRRSATSFTTTSNSVISYARDDRTASDAYRERVGVCRDFAHLAITFCRCMNIPARYCTGYLGDIGVRPDLRRWISALGSRCFSMAVGSLSMHGTTAPHRSYSDRTGTRCSGRSDLDKLRSSTINAFQSVYRRTRITKQCPGGLCPQSELCLTSPFEKWQCVAKAIRHNANANGRARVEGGAADRPLRRCSVRRHHSEMVFCVLVVIFGRDDIPGSRFFLGEREISLIAPLGVLESV